MIDVSGRNKKGIIAGADLLIGCLAGTMVACASGPKALSVEGPLELKIQGRVGHEDRSLVHSHSHERIFEQGQLIQEKEEAVDFAVETKTLKVDEQGQIYQQISVVEKDGVVDLHGMAYPELGETLDVILTPTSRVIKSGGNAPDSIFFVPPIPLPEKPVAIGDTWELSWKWVSSSRVPLKLDMVGILKGLYSCGADQKERCALLELGGDVGLNSQELTSLALASKIGGYIYFSLETGTVIWSEIRNQESLVSQGGGRVDIDSCLEAVLVKPEAQSWPYSEKPACKAGEETRLRF